MTLAMRGLALSCLGAACAPNLDPDYGMGSDQAQTTCRTSLAPHDVQGASSVSPLLGQTLTVTGVATLAATLRRERGAGPDRQGFFLQSLEADADPLTSEALFVAWPGPAPVTGTRVRVLGTVGESAGMTQLDAVERLDECGTALLRPEVVDLRELDDAEALEAMWVRARGDWRTIEVHAGSGAVTASPHGRLYASGHALAGGPPPELWVLRSASSGSADDGQPPPRLGSELDEIAGVLWVEGSSRQLLTARPPAWRSEPPAPPPRPPGPGLRLVGLNLNNYFVSLDGRGARSAGELDRQRDALVAALAALDADVLALTELENRGADSLIHLLEGLDRALPSDRRYAFEERSPPSDGVLRAGIAYRPQRLRSRGAAWFSSARGFRRAPLFQSFESEGFAFTLGVVHLPSKRCDGEPTVVSSEGCGDDTRRREAELLLDEARALATSAPLEPLLLMGDFNADVREAPLELLAQGGFSDLLSGLPAPDRYSYVFEGRASLLDHALGGHELRARLGASAIWHINADEVPASSAGPEASAPSARRSSDHDPIVIDLHLREVRPMGL